MNFYLVKNKLLISKDSYNFPSISDNQAQKYEGVIYALNNSPLGKNRIIYTVSNEMLLFLDREDLNILLNVNNKTLNCSFEKKDILSPWLLDKIKDRKVQSLNTNYEFWMDFLDENSNINFTLNNCNYNLHPKTFKKWRVNVVGLGDVGATLITGLRLLSGEYISEIGIFDKDENKMNRLDFECNQILSPDPSLNLPEIIKLNEEDLFNCDMFVFVVSVGIPPVVSAEAAPTAPVVSTEAETTGTEKIDVRMAQFKGNSKIVSYYASLSRKHNFNGIFAVVSDPVDLLCKVAYESSNTNELLEKDHKGLRPEQIRGYGLGVMNARAAYFANKSQDTNHYLKEGRAFGPHGEGLVIADSIKNYNKELSASLTFKTKTANLDVRAVGFKPYIAPALSSGSYSLIATIKGDFHYSAVYIGGTYMGCRNRLLNTGTELETYDLPDELFKELNKTYTYLEHSYNLL